MVSLKQKLLLAKAWFESKLAKPVSDEQAAKMLNRLQTEANNDFYGRDERDIEWLFETLMEYRMGKLKIMPLAALNIMSPVLPRDQDYNAYDDEVRRRISLLKDKELERLTRYFFLPLEAGAFKHSSRLNLRETRNLHNYQLLERLATVSEDEFVEFIQDYFGNKNYNLCYDKFKIPRAFSFVPREDDSYPYFE